MCVWVRIRNRFPAELWHQQQRRMSTCLPFHDTMKNYVNFVMIFEFPGIDELLESFPLLMRLAEEVETSNEICHFSFECFVFTF